MAAVREQGPKPAARCAWCKRPLAKRRKDHRYHLPKCKKDAENWRRLFREARR